MKVCIGGTFDIIHKGHERLIMKAFSLAKKNGFVFIGLSDEKLIEKKRNLKEYNKRKKQLNNFLKKQDFKSKYIIKKITDIYGPTLKEDFDIIVVSEESVKNAELINQKRKKLGKKPIKIEKIPYVLAEDGLPISTTRIKNKEIDKDGKKI